MEQAKVIEMVLWQPIEGVSEDQTKELMMELNDFVSQQPGFVSRSTGLAEDGQFIDVVQWTDLASAQAASEKAMKEECLAKVFAAIHQETMVFKHFEVFNQFVPERV